MILALVDGTAGSKVFEVGIGKLTACLRLYTPQESGVGVSASARKARGRLQVGPAPMLETRADSAW